MRHVLSLTFAYFFETLQENCYLAAQDHILQDNTNTLMTARKWYQEESRIHFILIIKIIVLNLLHVFAL